MTLSIVVITMNRAEQLRSALISCLNSKLPIDTEFIIIDNASTDQTEIMVRDFFSENRYPFIYEKETINLGVGGGRNRGFDLAKGDIIYFMDDDAVISPDSYSSFFMLPISLFAADRLVASITTRIYDELLECDRAVQLSKKNQKDSIPEVFMYLGGSHFLRRSYYEKPLYLDFKYGMEELLPSIFAIDAGFKNCYLHQISILHQPKRNKWLSGTSEKRSIIVDYNVNNYVSKRLIYPAIFAPLLFLSFLYRTLVYFGFDYHMWRESMKTQNSRIKGFLINSRKVHFKTVISIAKNYSIGTAL